MSPHAITPPEQSPPLHHYHRPTRAANKSLLKATAENELHDLICVGFGPASLAIAVALHDLIEEGSLAFQAQAPKVAFLEKQEHFAWHPGMLLEGAKMQISFIKDMATLRNPRSSFTFLNYLHAQNRLVQFSNLDTFLPYRIEFEAYLRWCASWFDDVAHYAQEVVEVRPDRASDSHHAAVESFTVVSKDTRTGDMSARRARNVVIAAGGRPEIPAPFPAEHTRVLHSSRFANGISKILPDQKGQYNIAVVGGGQSAAEIFENLSDRYANAQTRLIIKGSALRPSDDSPFVNEIFNPESVDPFYQQSSEARISSNNTNRSTNYGVVRLELLERIYEKMYLQRLRQPDESRWQHRILSSSLIQDVTFDDKARLQLQIQRNGEASLQTFDAVIVATGYARDAHREILAPTKALLTSGDDPEATWDIGRDYKIKFREGAVSEDSGIYLQGCCERTHGLADSLLSILSVRGAEVVESIFGR